ncbi:hypothetical protein [Actinophytocola sp.]|uniref:hypothetical protein n=1 Tax=Actinophytocola sp. TaxID=1872138 RepID=UPI002D461A3F|nr:hypothetical protein [Actinophytocola sp.]HYQ69658.1 hypothetical protein [Actinophytocola sp.]
MTPGARATALLVAAVVAVVAFVVAAVAAHHLAARVPEPAPRHRLVTRHRRPPRREWLAWTVSTVARWYCREDGGPKSGVLLASLFVAFSFLIGASQ